MSKSSRFLWLSGAILLSAVVGCKSNCCSNGSCGPTPGAGGPITTGTAYPSSAYPTGGGGGMTSSPMGHSSSSYPGMGGGAAAYPSQAGSGGFPAPTTSSTMYPGMNGAH